MKGESLSPLRGHMSLKISGVSASSLNKPQCGVSKNILRIK
jgi:hypothetical protein